jgi:hypothetical protein
MSTPVVTAPLKLLRLQLTCRDSFFERLKGPTLLVRMVSKFLNCLHF